MPLPISDTKAAWPPPRLSTVLDKVREWDAWWTGDIDRLAAVYGGVDSSRQATGGAIVKVAKSVKRWFVGEPTSGQDRNTKVPVPIAAEMCQASSDLLFSDPFTVTVKAAKTQERLDEILDDDFHTTIAEAAEIAAAHGGVYLVAAWDDTVAQQAFPTVRATDQADPEFRFGRLTAVTFWSVVKTQGDQVWRHLERHEARNGIGVILHGLYLGTTDTLGTLVGLDESDVTAPLAVHVDLDLPGTITTGSPGLAVTYIPNQTPNRMWRTDNVGRNLGRSDLDGTERLMDELVETMSDLMRARRAARARVLHSKTLAKSLGVGRGSVIDTAQETYVGVDALGGSAQAKLTDMVQVVQPTFDPSGYLTTARALTEQIVELAGYSAQTFGLDTGASGESSGTRTATEVESRERRSLMTRSRKLREWKPALLRFVEKLLLIDAYVFATGATDVSDIAIEFSDGVQDAPLVRAQTAQALYVSQSGSVEERVAIVHPDWQDEQVQAEAAKIRAEFALTAMQDPADPAFRVDDEETDGADEPAAGAGAPADS